MVKKRGQVTSFHLGSRSTLGADKKVDDFRWLKGKFALIKESQSKWSEGGG